jgi:hypothetical protein
MAFDENKKVFFFKVLIGSFHLLTERFIRQCVEIAIRMCEVISSHAPCILNPASCRLVYSSLRTSHPISCPLYPVSYILYPAPCLYMHPYLAPCILHPMSCTLCPVKDVLQLSWVPTFLPNLFVCCQPYNVGTVCSEGS